MFPNLALVSAICLALAFSGWESDTVSTSLMISDNSPFTDRNDLYEWNETQNGTNYEEMVSTDYLRCKYLTDYGEPMINHTDSIYNLDLTDRPLVTLMDPEDDQDDIDDYKGQDFPYICTESHNDTDVDNGFNTEYNNNITRGVKLPVITTQSHGTPPGGKHNIFLIALRLTTPLLMIIMHIKDRIEKSSELFETDTAEVKGDIKRDDGTRIMTGGKGDCKQKRRGKDKAPPVIENPGRQQLRRGPTRKQRRLATANDPGIHSST